MRLLSLILILCAAVATGSAQSEPRADVRDLIKHVQDDLKRAADFGNNGDIKKVKRDEKEIERYRNAQRSASNFDRHLSKGKFDKGELDGLINDIKNVVEHNTLESQDRDALTNDLRDLRDLRSRS